MYYRKIVASNEITYRDCITPYRYVILTNKGGGEYRDVICIKSKDATAIISRAMTSVEKTSWKSPRSAYRKRIVHFYSHVHFYTSLHLRREVLRWIRREVRYKRDHGIRNTTLLALGTRLGNHLSPHSGAE